MDREALRKSWKCEEDIAHIEGWDFSHIDGRCEEGGDLPWDYDTIVRQHLKPEMKLLDCDTGGGEYLLSLNHPYSNTAATEGYPPNVELCQKKLLPLGIDMRECGNPARIPFADASFDIIINRHGAFEPGELFRLLKPGGVFVTQQVGDKNDRDLVRRVLPELPTPMPRLNLAMQRRAFEEAGFDIVKGDEAFRPIRFFDIGAFVWFARIIEWEFTGFTVDRCFDHLLELQQEIEASGVIEGTTHRYLIVARKP